MAIVATLAALLSLVLANVMLGQAAFRVSDLERSVAEKSVVLEEATLEVEMLRAPSRIAQRARELGLVRGSAPTVIIAPGTTSDVRGPSPARGRP